MVSFTGYGLAGIFSVPPSERLAECSAARIPHRYRYRLRRGSSLAFIIATRNSKRRDRESVRKARMRPEAREKKASARDFLVAHIQIVALVLR
jgi:hypothetical protein